MRLFGASSGHRIQPAWTYNAKGAIWGIHPAGAGMLVGEERRVEDRKAVFFCLDRENGQELWQLASPGNDWWIGIEGVFGDTVLFYGFATPNLPQHRGIIAVDVSTGKKLWENSRLEFSSVTDTGVLASSEEPDGHSWIELDLRTGERLRSPDAADVRSLKKEGALLARGEGNVSFPVPLELLSPEHHDVEAVIRSHYQTASLAGSVEVVEQEGWIVFGYHEQFQRSTAQDPLYTSVLKVVERSTGTLVYSDTIDEGLHALSPGHFVVQHDMLYDIKARQTLTAVRLTA